MLVLLVVWLKFNLLLVMVRVIWLLKVCVMIYIVLLLGLGFRLCLMVFFIRVCSVIDGSGSMFSVGGMFICSSRCVFMWIFRIFRYVWVCFSFMFSVDIDLFMWGSELCRYWIRWFSIWFVCGGLVWVNIWVLVSVL